MSKKKTARRARPAPTMQAAWKRTRALVEAMLRVMEQEVKTPGSATAQWDRLFGAKASAVANLEKLVQVLVELHAQVQAQVQEAGEAPLSKDELALLAEWMEEER